MRKQKGGEAGQPLPSQQEEDERRQSQRAQRAKEEITSERFYISVKKSLKLYGRGREDEEKPEKKRRNLGQF